VFKLEARIGELGAEVIDADEGRAGLISPPAVVTAVFGLLFLLRAAFLEPVPVSPPPVFTGELDVLAGVLLELEDELSECLSAGEADDEDFTLPEVKKFISASPALRKGLEDELEDALPLKGPSSCSLDGIGTDAG
jgi:hypothetical protein